MNINKQIEKMAAIIADCGICIYHGDVCTKEEEVSDQLALCIARVLYEQGYRKASDITREIFDKIEKLSKESIHQEISEEYGFVLSERYDGKEFNKKLTKFRKEYEGKFNEIDAEN